MTDDKEIEKNLVDVNHEIEVLSEKVQSIERIASTIESLAESGVEAFTKYMESKTKNKEKELNLKLHQHEKELELQDKAHKRMAIVLVIVLASIVGLLLAAMLTNRDELVAIILNSSLAIGAGAGLTSLFRKKDS